MSIAKTEALRQVYPEAYEQAEAGLGSAEFRTLGYAARRPGRAAVRDSGRLGNPQPQRRPRRSLALVRGAVPGAGGANERLLRRTRLRDRAAHLRERGLRHRRRSLVRRGVGRAEPRPRPLPVDPHVRRDDRPVAAHLGSASHSRRCPPRAVATPNMRIKTNGRGEKAAPGNYRFRVRLVVVAAYSARSACACRATTTVLTPRRTSGVWSRGRDSPRS